MQDDLISRQAVIDALKQQAETMSEWSNRYAEHRKGVLTAVNIVEDLPSVNPQKSGHWIDTGSGQECSECREIQYGYDSFRYFCANCGARMKG